MLDWFSSVVAQVCVLVAVLVCCPVAAGECSLYEGFRDSRCFWSDQLTAAVRNSQTSWVVEFYSSWCGHCQHFAPTWKQLATATRGWSSLVRLGHIDCSNSANSAECRKYKIMGYPSIKFFHAGLSNPASSDSKTFQGRRDMDTLQRSIIKFVESGAPSLQPLSTDTTGLSEPFVLVFEESVSDILGQLLIMEYISVSQLTLRRVTSDNVALVHHYSVLEFPSLVLHSQPTRYHVITGSGVKDPFSFFKSSINKLIKAGTTITTVNSLPAHNQVADSSNSQQHTIFVRPSMVDITSALSYTLRMEVPIHAIVSGTAFTALHRFIQLLERGFYTSHPDISRFMRGVRLKLDTRRLAGFITASDWIRLLDSKLNSTLIPHSPQWKVCAGSKPHLRGYSCGLWLLMHTLTILTLPSYSPPHSQPSNLYMSSREALHILAGFVRNFFSCEQCRDHFSKMASTLTVSPGVVYNGDAVLWLWEAHNIVSRRLRQSSNSDQHHPKMMFPSLALCPYCFIKVSPQSSNKEWVAPSWDNVGFTTGESLLPTYRSSVDKSACVYVWNRTAVLLYLCRYYTTQHVASADILHHAWPHTHPLTNHSYHRNQQPRPSTVLINGTDSNLFSMYYLLCFMVMVAALFALLKYKRFSTRLRYSNFK